MRILILASKLDSGGAERVASVWANGFVARGYEVAIATCCKQIRNRIFPLDFRVKIYNLDYGCLMRYAFFHYSFFAPILYRYVINKFHPDVIIGVLHPYAYQAKKALKGKYIPIINTEHNVFDNPQYAPMSETMKIAKFEWNKLFDHITVLTQADKDYIGNRLNHVTVLPNPLSLKPAAQVPTKKKVLLAAGRLNVWKVKGFDLLIEAWSRIAHKHPEWILNIAGTGDGKSINFIKNLIRKNKVKNRVNLIGYCKNLETKYTESSIFVLSSRYEGFGMVLIEAMSQGCACIACDYKGRQAEIITRPEEGIICPVDDVEALASAIDRMIINDDYRHLVQRNSLKRIEYYSLENTMKRWDDIFKELKLL